jgi:cyclic pyranopterin phosphate synthase
MEFSHINEEGRARMVDVSAKEETLRVAEAFARVYMKRETLDRIKEGSIKKGDVLAVAQVAGIMGAKSTSHVIPMCHPIMISGCDLSFSYNLEKNSVDINSIVKNTGQTGVEMEALTAVATAALTIYDMCKAIDKGMIISEVMLMKKGGGKSGDFRREE